MAQRTDLKLTNNATTGIDDLFYDPTADNGAGDFVFAPSDNQHIKDTINAFPGWWKQFPLDGVGIALYKNARTNPQAVINKVKQQLESDGYVCINPTAQIVNNILTVNPNATM